MRRTSSRSADHSKSPALPPSTSLRFSSLARSRITGLIRTFKCKHWLHYPVDALDSPSTLQTSVHPAARGRAVLEAPAGRQPSALRAVRRRPGGTSEAFRRVRCVHLSRKARRSCLILAKRARTGLSAISRRTSAPLYGETMSETDWLHSRCSAYSMRRNACPARWTRSRSPPD